MTDNQNSYPAEQQPTSEMVEAYALVNETIAQFDPEYRYGHLSLVTNDGRNFSIVYQRAEQYRKKSDSEKNRDDERLFTVFMYDEVAGGMEEWRGDADGVLRYFTIGKHIEGMPPIHDTVLDAANQRAEHSLSETNLEAIPSEEREEKAEKEFLSGVFGKSLEIFIAALDESDMGLNNLPATSEQIHTMNAILHGSTRRVLPSVSFSSDPVPQTLLPELVIDNDFSFDDLMKKIENMLGEDGPPKPEN